MGHIIFCGWGGFKIRVCVKVLEIMMYEWIRDLHFSRQDLVNGCLLKTIYVVKTSEADVFP